MKFRSKPAVIEAVPYLGPDHPLPPSVHQQGVSGFYVVTIHGQRAFLADGDWIATEPDNVHHYPIKPDVFAKRWGPLPAYDPDQDRQVACPICFPGAVTYGEIMPGYWLVCVEGRWCVMYPNGEPGNDFLYFADKPTPDPDPLDQAHDDDLVMDTAMTWLEGVELDWRRPDLEEGYWFVTACVDAGWERGKTPRLDVWLWDRAGKMLAGKAVAP